MIDRSVLIAKTLRQAMRLIEQENLEYDLKTLGVLWVRTQSAIKEAESYVAVKARCRDASVRRLTPAR